MAANDELIGFVREALSRGVARDEVASALARSGWSPARVRAALAGFSDVAFPVPVPRPRPSLDARDAFLYLVLFTTLYLSAWHFGSLVFQLIDWAFPDPAMAATDAAAAFRSSLARFSVASLVTAAPVFFFLSSITGREVRQDPTKRGSKVRRWLTYLTLFVGATVLIGDFTALVYHVLGGELTVRFVLKVATIAAIAGGAFGYYLLDLRADEREDGRDAGADRQGRLTRGRLFAVVAAVAATGAVAASLAIIGSPAEARVELLDLRRVQDLTRTSTSIDLYWTREGHLPASLADLPSAPRPLTDPDTGAPYAYRVIDAGTYELCATFARASADTSPRPTRRFWTHEAGRQCFTIEPQRIER
ncbi:MAG: DUF5671 domain-containing protein [Vicinamibacterales bacterium]